MNQFSSEDQRKKFLALCTLLTMSFSAVANGLDASSEGSVKKLVDESQYVFTQKLLEVAPSAKWQEGLVDMQFLGHFTWTVEACGLSSDKNLTALTSTHIAGNLIEAQSPAHTNQLLGSFAYGQTSAKEQFALMGAEQKKGHCLLMKEHWKVFEETTALRTSEQDFEGMLKLTSTSALLHGKALWCDGNKESAGLTPTPSGTIWWKSPKRMEQDIVKQSTFVLTLVALSAKNSGDIHRAHQLWQENFLLGVKNQIPQNLIDEEKQAQKNKQEEEKKENPDSKTQQEYGEPYNCKAVKDTLDQMDVLVSTRPEILHLIKGAKEERQSLEKKL